MANAPCPRCNTSPPYTFWCCTEADDDGPPWATLQFYDVPLTAFRIRDDGGTRWAEVREYDREAGTHQTVTIGATDLAAIAEALDVRRG